MHTVTAWCINYKKASPGTFQVMLGVEDYIQQCGSSRHDLI